MDRNTTFLRRPISINYVDRKTNEVWFLVQLVGDGTRKLATVNKGDTVNVVLPLGNGFSMPENTEKKLLLVGGGVGTAPMLYLGEALKKMDANRCSCLEHVRQTTCCRWNSLKLLAKCIPLLKTVRPVRKDM